MIVWVALAHVIIVILDPEPTPKRVDFCIAA